MLRSSLARLSTTQAAVARPMMLRLYSTAKKYALTHEWISVDNGVGTVGISDHAQDQLGVIVYAELPDVGETFEKGSAFCVVESVKATSDVYTPVSGKVVEVNKALVKTAKLINESAEDKGWMVKIKLDDAKELDALLDEAAYKKHAESDHH